MFVTLTLQEELESKCNFPGWNLAKKPGIRALLWQKSQGFFNGCTWPGTDIDSSIQQAWYPMELRVHF